MFKMHKHIIFRRSTGEFLNKLEALILVGKRIFIDICKRRPRQFGYFLNFLVHYSSQGIESVKNFHSDLYNLSLYQSLNTCQTPIMF